MAPTFKEKLKSPRPLIGTLLTLSNSVVSELLSLAGFDWLWIDMEHAPLSLEQAQALLQAKSAECSALIRIPENNDVWIKRVLDLGPDGIIVPQVKSAQEAEKAVTAASYPPRGTRSVGLSRANAYGMDFTNYVQRANDSVSILLQIEHIEGVNNLEAILKVEGIDGIVIGPYDLSGSLDKLGKVQDKEVIEAIDHIRQLCQKANLPCGIFTLQTEAAQSYLKQGFRLVALGIDTYYLWYSARASLNTVKSQLVEERSSAWRS